MARSKLRIQKGAPIMATVKPGEKVKVYSGTCVSNQVIRYGEVIGIRQHDNKLLLNERADFKDLKASQFNHFREAGQVAFLNSMPESHWKPMLADVKGVVISQSTKSREWKQIITSSGKTALLKINGKEDKHG